MRLDFLERILGRKVNPEEVAMMWSQTVSGRRVNPLTLSPDEVSIADIAQGLAAKNRFNGQTRPLLTVAQHSVMVAQRCTSKLQGLMHDASEAYTWDLPRPVKKMLRLAGITIFDEIEQHVHLVICERFGIPPEIPEDVHAADVEVCCTEGEYFFGNMAAHRDWEWTHASTPCIWPPNIVAWTPEAARAEFERAFYLLTRSRRGMDPVRDPARLVDPSWFEKLTIKKEEEAK